MSEQTKEATNSGVAELFADQKEELPEEWHETFDELTSQGKSPSGIKATIEYVTTSKTQQEVSREYSVSEVTIRNLQAAVIALGPLDGKRAAQHGTGRHTAMDYCNHIADRLGWEEDVEYSTKTNAPSSSPQPMLKKAGWRSLAEEVIQQMEERET